MAQRRNQSDGTWYLNLKILLMFWEEITGSLSNKYLEMYRDRFRVYLTEILDENEGRESSFFDIYKKKLHNQYKRHLPEEDTIKLLLSYLLDSSKRFKPSELNLAYDYYMENEAKTPESVLYNYAVLNRILDTLGTIQSFEDFADFRREILAHLHEIHFETIHFETEVKEIDKEIISVGNSIEMKIKVDYLKHRLKTILIALSKKYWKILCTYEINRQIIKTIQTELRIA